MGKLFFFMIYHVFALFYIKKFIFMTGTCCKKLEKKGEEKDERGREMGKESRTHMGRSENGKNERVVEEKVCVLLFSCSTIALWF